MTRTREQIEKRLAQLNAQQAQGREMIEHFPLGWVGTGGKAVQALNQRKLQGLDQTIDRANEIVALERELEHLIAREQASERQAKREAKEAAHLQVIEEKLKKARPGDEVVLCFGSRAVIKRINKKSISTLGGARYAISAIQDIIPQSEDGPQK